MNIKELFENKKVINGFKELVRPLNKRGYDIEFFNRGNEVGFIIVKKNNE